MTKGAQNVTFYPLLSMTRKKELPKPLYIQCSNFLTAIEYISSVTFWFVKMIVKSQFVAQMAQTNNWVGPVQRPVPLSLGRMPCYSQLKMAHLWPRILSLLLNQETKCRCRRCLQYLRRRGSSTAGIARIV